MRGDPDGHMLVGEVSGANKAGGCPRKFLPFTATVGAWQRLTAPHQPCVLGWWKPAWPPGGDSPRRGHLFRDTLGHQNPSSNPVDARKTRHKTPQNGQTSPTRPKIKRKLQPHNPTPIVTSRIQNANCILQHQIHYPHPKLHHTICTSSALTKKHRRRGLS